MANIRPRKDKAGNIISYEIRVYKGRDENGKQLKPYTMTYKPAENMTEKQIEKELNKQAVQFEEQCRLGISSDNRQTFQRYAEYVLQLKERTGIKHSTLCRYRELLQRINAGIGHIKLSDIRPQHLNILYEQLAKDGLRMNSKKAVCTVDFKDFLKRHNVTKELLSRQAGVSLQTLTVCQNHKNIGAMNVLRRYAKHLILKQGVYLKSFRTVSLFQTKPL